MSARRLDIWGTGISKANRTPLSHRGRCVATSQILAEVGCRHNIPYTSARAGPTGPHGTLHRRRDWARGDASRDTRDGTCRGVEFACSTGQTKAQVRLRRLYLGGPSNVAMAACWSRRSTCVSTLRNRTKRVSLPEEDRGPASVLFMPRKRRPSIDQGRRP